MKHKARKHRKIFFSSLRRTETRFRLWQQWLFLTWSFFKVQVTIFLYEKNIGRLTLVRQRPMKSLSSVCSSVRPSVRPSVTNLSQDWIISFAWYCTWLLLNMISSDWQNQIFEKKFDGSKLGQMCQNWAQNWVFCDFLKFDSLPFFEISYDDCLQQCPTSSRSKIHEKNFGAQILFYFYFFPMPQL